MKYILESLIFLAFIFLISGCKKSETFTPRNPAVNVLCNGNSSNSFYPVSSNFSSILKLLNSDTLKTEKYLYAGDTLINLLAYAIIEKQNFIVDIPSGVATFNFYRTDLEGNVFKYFTEYAGEFLFAPIDPISDSVIASYPVLDGEFLRKVVDINANYATAACEYNGLMKIQEIIDTEDDEQIINTYYYKNGLGLIAKEEQLGLNILVSNLTQVDF